MLKDTKPRDIRAGEMTYGERIQLGRICTDESLGDYERIRQVIQCLHEIDVQPREAAELSAYVVQVIEGLAYWVEQEQKQLYIPPTNEEQQAGIAQLSKACGDMGNVVTLAETYRCSFAQVYAMPYTEVFTIQKIHTERSKFERRLNNVYLKKR